MKVRSEAKSELRRGIDKYLKMAVGQELWTRLPLTHIQVVGDGFISDSIDVEIILDSGSAFRWLFRNCSSEPFSSSVWRIDLPFSRMILQR